MTGHATDVCCYCAQPLDDGRPVRTVTAGIKHPVFRRCHVACRGAYLDRERREREDRPEVRR